MNQPVWRALLFAVVIIAVVTGARVFAARHPARAPTPQQENSVTGRVPVLVELFTSEGCSSCPPADGLLARLVETQPVEGAEVVALEEHVDYWNRLGWTDPYSSSGFTQRQAEYSEAFGLEGAYTPQMVVDGQAEFVGSDERQARQSIAQAAREQKTRVQIALAPGEQSPDHVTLTVKLAGAEAKEADRIILAFTEDKLSTVPARGENSGRAWGHSSVARLTVLLGEQKPGAGDFSATAVVTLPPEWRRQNMRVVAFVQEEKTRRIRGVGVTSLTKLTKLTTPTLPAKLTPVPDSLDVTGGTVPGSASPSHSGVSP